MSTITSPRKYKLVALGEQSVGKTSLITRFMYNTIENKYQATIGIDFFTKKLTVKGRQINLQLWDTAGQERFRSLIPSYIRESDIALVVYDITCKNSFEKTNKWINEVRKISHTSDITIVLVGNKADREEEREVDFQVAKDRAKELDIRVIETSAKTGYNVKKMFNGLIVGVYDKNDNNDKQKEQTRVINLLPEKEKQEQYDGSYCC